MSPVKRICVFEHSSWQILTAHAQPFRGARDLAFCLKFPLDSLLVWSEQRRFWRDCAMRRLAWTFAARIGDKYQIRLTRSKWRKSKYTKCRPGYGVDVSWINATLPLEKGCGVPYHSDHSDLWINRWETALLSYTFIPFNTYCHFPCTDIMLHGAFFELLIRANDAYTWTAIQEWFTARTSINQMYCKMK